MGSGPNTTRDGDFVSRKPRPAVGQQNGLGQLAALLQLDNGAGCLAPLLGVATTAHSATAGCPPPERVMHSRVGKVEEARKEG